MTSTNAVTKSKPNQFAKMYSVMAAALNTCASVGAACDGLRQPAGGFESPHKVEERGHRVRRQADEVAPRHLLVALPDTPHRADAGLLLWRRGHKLALLVGLSSREGGLVDEHAPCAAEPAASPHHRGRFSFEERERNGIGRLSECVSRSAQDDTRSRKRRAHNENAGVEGAARDPRDARFARQQCVARRDGVPVPRSAGIRLHSSPR